MRVLTLSASVALALACRASAAGAAMPTAEGSSVVVERPDGFERGAAAGLGPQESWPCGVFSSMFAGMTSSINTHSTAATVSTAPVTANDNLAMRGTEDADIDTTLESPSGTPPQPYATVGCILDSYADLLACAEAGLLDAFCPSAVSSVPITRRDEIAEGVGPRSTSWVTVESTSTIASTTTTVYMTSSSSSASWTGWVPPKIAMETDITTSTTTNPTYGVSIVETTIMKTVTYQPSDAHTSAVGATNAPMIETCSNSTSISISAGTQTYLNISTFSMTGYTPLPVPTSSSMSPFFTPSSGIVSTDSTKFTTSHTTAGPVSTGKPPSSTTVTLGSGAGASTIDLSAFQLPTTMLVAMAVCFVLAFFL